METTSIKKTDKIIYWITTGFLILLYFGSGTMYILNTEMVNENMLHLGFPTWLTYFLIPLKFAGISVAVFTKWKVLKEWAYAGMFFNCLLALIAHLMAKDPISATVPAILGTTFVLISYFYSKRMNK